MKLGSLPLVLGAFVLGAVGANAQTTAYNGNGASGFGGYIGGSTLTISSTSTAINFSLSTPSSFSSNGLALYIDSTSGGFNSTANFTDVGDSGRTVLSGVGNGTRTTATFATGFNADFGLSIQPNNFAGLFSLKENGSFGFVNSANLTTAVNGSGTLLTFSVNRGDIGLGATDGFNFVASLISTSAFRSDETIGTSATVPDSIDNAPNAGFNGTQTFSAFDTYGTPVPEPTTWVAGGLTVLVGSLALRRHLRTI